MAEKHVEDLLDKYSLQLDVVATTDVPEDPCANSRTMAMERHILHRDQAERKKLGARVEGMFYFLCLYLYFYWSNFGGVV